MGGDIVLVVCIVIYFIPFFVAGSKRNATAIGWLNLFLGWTIIGWVGALIWALYEDKETHEKRVRAFNENKAKNDAVMLHKEVVK